MAREIYEAISFIWALYKFVPFSIKYSKFSIPILLLIIGFRWDN